MRILFTSLGFKSHFLPLVPIIDACTRNGHEVAVAAPPTLAEYVAAANAVLVPLGNPDAEPFSIPFKRMRSRIGAALPVLSETIERRRPALVVRESQEYAAVIAAEKFSIPHARVAISAASGAPHPHSASRLDHYRLATGLSPDPSGERIQNETVLTQFPRSLDPISNPSCTYRFRIPRAPAAPLPEWWTNAHDSFVYATLGTVTGGIARMHTAYEVLLDAVRNLPVRVLLTLGHGLSPDDLRDVPQNVHVEEFVPQEKVLPHARAVICHGGSGTVLGVLAAGVPLVLTPLFADQAVNADRIATIGAGIALSQPLASSDLRRALAIVMEQESYRTAAKLVAAEMAALPLAAEAVLSIQLLASSGC